ncbi:MAG: ATP-grasp domain-containing protein [archaeon]
MKVVILNNYLGKNPTKDELDNIVETKAVEKALKELNFEVFVVPFSFDIRKNIDRLKKINPDFVFNLVESIEGNDSLQHFAPAILDLLEIPCTGCSSESMYLSLSKITTKKIFQSNGIKTPKWMPLGKLSKKNIFGKKQIIIKHLWEHSSEDIDYSSVFSAENKAKLSEAMKKRKNLDNYFAEEYIDGREFNISVIEDSNRGHVLSPAEMTFVDYPKEKVKIVNYKAKWDEESFESKHTIRKFDFEKRDKKLILLLKKISKDVWDIFELKGYARVDFRVDKKGVPYVLEVNTNPCISPDSGFVAACAKEGISFKEVISKIIESSCKKAIAKN